MRSAPPSESQGASEFDPAAIIQALGRHGVRYVVIGGVASVLHGAPTVTTDIDVAVKREKGAEADST